MLSEKTNFFLYTFMIFGIGACAGLIITHTIKPAFIETQLCVDRRVEPDRVDDGLFDIEMGLEKALFGAKLGF